ncbi:MAG: prephenate dehydrogenase/arogenate dehydrogenase family protein [Elusimicrobiota bacterium]
MTEREALQSIRKLRKRIRAVDAGILALLRRRLSLARRVGEAKAAAGLPVRDFKTESGVLDAARSYCEKSGLSPDLGEEIVRTLTRGSVEVQERIRHGRFQGGLKDVLVLGGCGAMGRWFADFFDAQGHRVRVADTRRGARSHYPLVRDAAGASREADIVVIAAPIRGVGPTLRMLRESGTRALVFDIASVKSPFLGEFRSAAASLRIGSIHPMFGPDAKLLSGRTLILCDAGRPEDRREIRSLFQGTALSIVEMPLKDHDRWMACILGLSHLVNILYFDALASSGRRFSALQRFGSTTFERQSDASRQVAFENARLYYDIQSLNPGSRAVMKALRSSLERVDRAVRSGRPDAFLSLMRRGRGFFGS